MLRPVAAVALLLLFAILVASVWVFIAVSLWESALICGAATLAAIAVLLPGLVAVMFLGRPTAAKE